MVISAPMLEELADVLNRPRIRDKFKIEEEDITRLLFLLEDRAEDVRVSENVTVCRDKDDNLVIETAIRGKVEYLVTRDDDIKFDEKVSSFLSQYGISVVSIAKFLSLINKV